MTALPIFVPDLLAVTVLTVLAYAVGRHLTMRLPFGSAAESIALSITLGLGTLATLTFALGLFGLLQRWAVGAFLLAVLVVCWPAVPGGTSGSTGRWLPSVRCWMTDSMAPVRDGGAADQAGQGRKATPMLVAWASLRTPIQRRYAASSARAWVVESVI